ncbi:hypothetical protein DPX39_030049500 [Trypanosoma brucei equiperdum]|uniref:Uncharacterized protein n=1 Tax=Trypanosoma brucei equiperdum TaxID=630700 RepID=A0A3L6LAR7_9TRYP|nr:hypothetical protein DPX39_030049500 [Trypanosoma brucei equiperdum]
MGTIEGTTVDFDPNPLQRPTKTILVGNEDAAAGVLPRTSRHIDFTDDGKLFEGHFTLQASSLKSIIQVLADQQAEQRVIINDLQDQVNNLRQQTSKMRKSVPTLQLPASVGGSAKSFSKEYESLEQRVKSLEGFRSLWGARTEDVDGLISIYGDPVVTPDEYTTYIMNLQPFRVVRSEARHFVTSQAEQQKQAVRTVGGERNERTRGARSARLADPGDAADDGSRTPREGGSRAPRDGSQSGRDGSRGPRSARNRQAHDAERKSSRDDDTRTIRDDNNFANDDNRSGRDETRGRRRVREPQSNDDGTRSPIEESHANRDDTRPGRDDSRGSRRQRNRQSHEDDLKSFHEEDARTHRGGPRGARDRVTYGEHLDSRDGLRQDNIGDGDTISDLSKRLQLLEQRVRSVHGGHKNNAQGSASEQLSPTSDATGAKDLQAREDIEELSRFVAKRFKELERSIAKVQGGDLNVTAPKAGMGARKSETPPKRRERSPTVMSKGQTGAGGSGPGPSGAVESDLLQKAGKPREIAPSYTPVVDEVARDDAAAALEQVELLEKYVVRKLKELTPSLSKGVSDTHISSPPIGSTSTQPPERPSGESHVPRGADRSASEKVAVDQAAREDTSRLFELVHDLEDDWGKRWASLEERLRIIGRAAVNKGSVNAAAPGTIDRRAREDASISLMRVQQLEREISSFRRLLMKRNGAPMEVGLFEGRMQSGGASKLVVDARDQKEPNDNGCAALGAVLEGADSQSRVLALEKEVESRMEEVNRALATLRTAQVGQDFPDLSFLGDDTGTRKSTAPSQIVISTREMDLAAAGNFRRPTPDTKTYAAMLVMSSYDPAQPFHGSYSNYDQGNPIVLRPPQMETFATPLVRREPQDNLTPRTRGEAGVAVGTPQHEKSPVNKAATQSGEAGLSPSGTGSCPIRMSGPAPHPPDGSAICPVAPHKQSVMQHLGDMRSVSSRVRGRESTRMGSQNILGRETVLGTKGRAGLGLVAESSALGHRTPCVVPNCAWCAVQNVKATVKTAR